MVYSRNRPTFPGQNNKASTANRRLSWLHKRDTAERSTRATASIAIPIAAWIVAPSPEPSDDAYRAFITNPLPPRSRAARNRTAATKIEAGGEAANNEASEPPAGGAGGAGGGPSSDSTVGRHAR